MRPAPPPLPKYVYEQRKKALQAQGIENPTFLQIDTALAEWHAACERQNKFCLIMLVACAGVVLLTLLIVGIIRVFQ